MYIPDYHVHTKFSGDCEESIFNIVSVAKQKGMQELCITDHYDMNYPLPEMDFDLDIPVYISTYKDAASTLLPGFDLMLGIELGVMPETCRMLNTLVETYPELDFVLCSLHVIDGYDPYYPGYFDGKTKKEAYEHYFETLLQCVRVFYNFDVCAHLDYIVRYGTESDYRVADYYDIFRELFSVLISRGQGIELNTGSLSRGLSFFHPHPDVLKIYRECGGEIITFGSDAHHAEQVGNDFSYACDILKECGFSYYATYEKRTPSFHRL